MESTINQLKLIGFTQRRIARFSLLPHLVKTEISSQKHSVRILRKSVMLILFPKAFAT